MNDINDSEFFLQAPESVSSKQHSRLLDTVYNVKNVFAGLFKGLSSLGESISMITVLAVKSFAKMSLGALKKLGIALKPIFKKSGVLAKLVLLKGMMPFVRIYAGCKTLSQRYKVVKKGCGAKFAASDCAHTFANMLWRSKRHLASLFNVAAPIASVAFFFGLFNYISGLEYAVSVEYNGQELGFIETEGDVEQAQVEVLKRISYVDENETVSFTPKFSLKIIDAQSQYIGTNELADKMIVNSSEELAQAYGLYIGEDFYGAVSAEDYDEVLGLLDEILAEYGNVSGAYNVRFVNTPALTSGLYLTESIITAQQAQELFNGTVAVQCTYTIQSGDTPDSIAKKNNMTIEELRTLNPDIDNICYAGAKVTVTKQQNFLPVTYSVEKKSTENIAHTSITVDDASLTKGKQQIAIAGEDGILETTEEVVYIDGEISSRNVVSTNVIKEPVAEEVHVGTKEVAQTAYYPVSEYTGAIENLGTGTFNRPCTTGYVSCYFSSWHHGVDIATSYGTPICAADDGTVIVAGWHSSYGNYVMIDHGNGYITLYAHASALNVEAGTKVTKGTKIAEVGSTGNSSGNHVHFEVRLNGAYTNPLNYISE